MNVSRIPTGRDAPRDVNVVIAIPQGSSVRYEIDRTSGAIFVDSFLFTPMTYPAAQGFIPGVRAENGGPLTALVLLPCAVVPGCVVRARPIGMLIVEDDAGQSSNIVCVPHDRVHPQYSHIETIDDLPPINCLAIEHFYERYRDLQAERWVKVLGWGDKVAAESTIAQAVSRNAMRSLIVPLADAAD